MKTDIIQKYGRKLKNPQLRKWKRGSGDDYFYVYPFSKKKLDLAVLWNKVKPISKGYFTIAYKGKEYSPSEFLKKFPKYKLKRKKK